VGSTTITRLLRAGVLKEIHRGVYRVTSVTESREAEVLAAIYATGDGAVASHRTAAALWGFADIPLAPPYHITSARRCQKKLLDVAVHTTRLERLDRTVLGRVPVTGAARSVLDTAALLECQDEVDELAVDGLRSGRATGSGYRDVLERAGAAPGAGRLRQTLSRFDPASAERLASQLETGFLLVFRRGGLPEPAVNSRVVEEDGLFLARTDFGWEPPAVHAEADGLRFHSGLRHKRYDDLRQNALVLSGRIVLRYSIADLDEPDRVVTEVRRALELGWERLGGRPARDGC
jgi:hypothetical protein